MILGQFQGNWRALVPIGGATFDTAQSGTRQKIVWKVENAPQVHWTIFPEKNVLRTYCKHHKLE
jgi:hypothetical protein